MRARAKSRTRVTPDNGRKRAAKENPQLEKAPTGIRGLDEITQGGLPKGRPTIVCGDAGAGKTLLAMEFLVRGATEYGEPGVFVSFEETPDELVKNVASLGFDLTRLAKRGQIHLEHVHIERSEIEETGEYDLEGLFVRLGYAVNKVKAKRIVLDTLESLFSGLPNEAILRAELRRLFRWLKERGLTAVVTGERGDKHFTRYGLEEYVSDCVVLLDHRVTEQVATRRLRIAKYRGSVHGTNEYPFLIDERGISVLPITSLGLTYGVSEARVSTGIGGLDAMMGGKGFFERSSILVSGSAGAGKTSLLASCVDAACRAGKKCLYLAFEESPDQIVRNMRSIGMDLGKWIDKGLLMVHSSRPSVFGLEMHLVLMHRLVTEFEPDVVAVDPMSGLGAAGSTPEIKSMLTRIIDFLKTSGRTMLCSSLSETGVGILSEEVAVSSLMDTWVVLRNEPCNGRRTRTVTILKSRGMAHSSDVREFELTDDGVIVRGSVNGEQQAFGGT